MTKPSKINSSRENYELWGNSKQACFKEAKIGDKLLFIDRGLGNKLTLAIKTGIDYVVPVDAKQEVTWSYFLAPKDKIAIIPEED